MTNSHDPARTAMPITSVPRIPTAFAIAGMLAMAAGLSSVSAPAADEASDQPWITIKGGAGPGQGKHVVLICGDEEYRSEEVIPQLARILARRHGFTCTVLFAIDPKDGTINPNVNTNIPGLESLRQADLAILFLRWRNLPDEQMRYLAEYIESGRPMIGLRTSTHAFNLKSQTYHRYTWDCKLPGSEGGFGHQVLGSTWINHHGEHGKEGTRGILVPEQRAHPVLRGIEPGTIFGTSDVYGVPRPLPGDSVPLVLGEVTETLKPDSKAVTGPKNNPMMPVAWVKSYKTTGGRSARVFTTTMGAAEDFTHVGTRRMIVNGVYWSLGMESTAPEKADVRFVGGFPGTPFGFRKYEDWKPGKRPADLPR